MGATHLPDFAEALSPLRAGQALRPLAFGPIRPHVRAYHPAFRAYRFTAEDPDRRIIRPAVGLNGGAVVAKTSAAIDQQPPDPMRSHVAERDRFGVSRTNWRPSGIASDRCIRTRVRGAYELADFARSR